MNLESRTGAVFWFFYSVFDSNGEFPMEQYPGFAFLGEPDVLRQDAVHAAHGPPLMEGFSLLCPARISGQPLDIRTDRDCKKLSLFVF
ncbi:MAG: hypothetical protein HY066_06175 [Betaproteobacteria bacterium]|nr:hypothetical protein [Betaproteobacteria bacterium]